MIGNPTRSPTPFKRMLAAWLTAVLLGSPAGASAQAAGASTTLPAASTVASPAAPVTLTGPSPVKSWPGVIRLAVDATDLDHRIQQVEQILPVPGSGPLTLWYPKWLPGHHGPYGQVSQLAGLQIQAAGRPVRWQRDPGDPHAFVVDVPDGAFELTINFQHITPPVGGAGRTSMTRAIVGVQWNQLILYPAGPSASAIQVQARVKLPEGWQAVGALRGPDGGVASAGRDGWIAYAATALDTLVDSPLFAGAHTKRIALEAQGQAQAVTLNLVADDAAALQASPQQIDAHKALVQQATRLFGVRPWRQYDFLLALSTEFGGIGLEHQESSENGVRPDYFKDWDKAIRERELLPHEFVHAWNGKYRRPADLSTPHYNTPMRNSLLWVYEGMTQYWGHVLATRSGLTTPEQARDRLAQTAASLDARVGRVWRDLQDTTNEGTIASQQRKPWPDWQRGVDFYNEAVLIWLDADTLIREKSGGQRSLDNFALAFFGLPVVPSADGSIKPLTYTFDDVVRTLNSVQPHDWSGFLRSRLDSHGPGAPLDGLKRAGWSLAWSTTESDFSKQAAGWGGPSGTERPADFAYSLGLRVFNDGAISEVSWNSPAFKAGLTPGLTLVAVNMTAYKPERLAEAIAANGDGKKPIQLLIKERDRYRQVSLDWRGGLRYPRLERRNEAPDWLGPIQAAR